MLLPFPVTQYCCSKGLSGMFFVLLRWPVVVLTVDDSLDSFALQVFISPGRRSPPSPLSDPLWTARFSLQPGLVIHACSVWKQEMTRAVQAAGAGKTLVPILEKLKGSWSEWFSSELQFQPHFFPGCCFTGARQNEGVAALLATPPHGMACCCQRAEPRIFCNSGKCGRVQHSLPEPICLPPLCCPCPSAAPRQALWSCVAPRLSFPMSHLLREGKRLL